MGICYLKKRNETTCLCNILRMFHLPSPPSVCVSFSICPSFFTTNDSYVLIQTKQLNF